MSISRRLLKRIVFLSTWHRYAIALVVGLLAALAAWSKSPGAAEAIAGWDGFALTMIAIGWARIVTSSPPLWCGWRMCSIPSRPILLTVMLGRRCASLGAVAFLLATKGGSHTKALPASALLAAGTVVCSWVLVHTMLTMHYAYLYYRTPGSRQGAGQAPRAAVSRPGLARLPGFRLLLFYHWHDFAGLGRGDCFTGDPPLGAAARAHCVCLQCRDCGGQC